MTSIFLVTATVWAQPPEDPCWAGGNYGAKTDGFFASTATVGVRSDEDLSATTPADPYTGTGIVHPLQEAYFDDVHTLPGDFVGWGTYRGVGTAITNATHNCPSDSASHWRIYVDGTVNGLYFCYADYGSLSTSASAQSFKIITVSCAGSTGWGFYLNGSQLTCRHWGQFPYTGFVGAGGEASGINDAGKLNAIGNDILVHHANLQVKFNSGWAYWNSGYWSNPPFEPCQNYLPNGSPALPYWIDKLSNTDFWVYSHGSP